MIARVLGADLREAVRFAGLVLPSRPTEPMSAALELSVAGGFAVRGAGELGQARAEVAGAGVTAGSVVVSRRLLEAVAAAVGDKQHATIEAVNRAAVEIVSGRSSWSLPGIPADYPTPIGPPDVRLGILEAGDLRDAVGRCVPAALRGDPSETNYGGIGLELARSAHAGALLMACTDRTRVSSAACEWRALARVMPLSTAVVDARTLAAVTARLEGTVALGASTGTLELEAGGRTAQLRMTALRAGRWVEWWPLLRNVQQAAVASVRVSPAKLAAAVRQVLGTADVEVTKARFVVLETGPGVLTARSEGRGGRSSAAIDAEAATGPGWRMVIDSRRLLDALDCLGAVPAVLMVTDPQQAIGFAPLGEPVMAAVQAIRHPGAMWLERA